MNSLFSLNGLPRVANSKCKPYVVECKPFRGHNLFGIFSLMDADQEVYTVYSYGEHFPLYIHTNGMWFENEDRFSASTLKHSSQARPSDTTIKLSTRWMQRLANNGYQGIAQERVLSTEPLEEA
jgi:hypothetical protein